MRHLRWVIVLLTLLPLISKAQISGFGDTSVCAGEYKIQLSARPTGGIYSGDSVMPDGRFNPDTTFLNPGSTNPVIITYTIGGVTSQARITVLPTPRVNILTQNQSICANAQALTLQATPAGGTWSGLGVDQLGVFTPVRTLVGVRTITYTYINPGFPQCPGTDDLRITVNDYTDVSAGPTITVCSKDDPILLTGATPSGGTYSGPGVSGGVFTPTEALVGANQIAYTFTNANQCTNSNTRFVFVNRTPKVFAGRDTTICENALPFNLQGYSPSNGIFENRDGVAPNGRYTPSSANVGFRYLVYQVTDQGCTGKDTLIVETLNAPRNVVAGRDTLICANSPAFNLVRGTPAGGRYFGSGVDSLTGRFTPADSLVGSQKIFYQVRIPRGCKAKDSLNINVRPLPRANAGIDFNACSNNSPVQVGDQRMPNSSNAVYSYLWSGSDGTFGFDSITKSNPTIRFINNSANPVQRSYYVKVTRTETSPPIACYNLDTVKVIIYPKPVSRSIPPLTTKACPGDSIILRAEVKPDYKFLWLNGRTLLTPSPSQLNATFTARSSGLYRLISLYDVEVRGGICADTSSGDSLYFKPVIKPTITGFANYCNGKTDTLRAYPRGAQFTFQWLKDSTTIIIGARDTIYNANRPGFYQVRLTDARDGLSCAFVSSSVRVDSIRTPYVDIVKLTNDSVFSICSAQLPFTVVAPEDTNYRGAFQYNWQDSSSSRAFTIDTTGKYYISVFNRCGRVTDTLNITTINSTPVFNIVPTANKEIRVCRGIPYIITGPSGNTFVYRTRQFDSTGAIINNNVTTSQSLPINTAEVGIYKISVLITSARGCSYLDTATVKVVDCEPTVYVPTAFTPQNDGLNDLWELQAYSVDDLKLYVFDRWGEMVYYASTLKELIDRPWNGRYKDKDCLSGAYQYVIEFTGRQPGTEDITKFKRTGTVTVLR